MKELKIYEYKAKQIEDTLRLAARVLGSHSKITSLDRDVMQGWEMIQNVLKGEPEKEVKRY